MLDLEELWLGRVEDFLAGKEVLRPADLTNKKTYQADHNATPIADIMASFRSARMELVQQLETCDESAVLRPALHPRLNTEMRVLDLVFFTAEHDDHHLAEITTLIRQLR